ncbi:hypothetical protein UlMin_027113 [Ulmus minor]
MAGDHSQALNDLCFKPNVNIDVSEGTAANVDNLPPIFLVYGIFGFGEGRLGGLSYFARAEKKDERVLVPNLGSLTSIYDRFWGFKARELFYYLKGGQVDDYGKEHTKAYGHSQFGCVYEQGHYPESDEDHPIHFIGNSAGAQVVHMLQQMLADKVLSITSLLGVFNGTTRTYLDGMNLEDYYLRVIAKSSWSSTRLEFSLVKYFFC